MKLREIPQLSNNEPLLSEISSYISSIGLKEGYVSKEHALSVPMELNSAIKTCLKSIIVKHVLDDDAIISQVMSVYNSRRKNVLYYHIRSQAAHLKYLKLYTSKDHRVITSVNTVLSHQHRFPGDVDISITALSRISGMTWDVVLVQLLSLLSHPSQQVQHVIRNILERIAFDCPFVVSWVLCQSDSIDNAAVRRMLELLKNGTMAIDSAGTSYLNAMSLLICGSKQLLNIPERLVYRLLYSAVRGKIDKSIVCEQLKNLMVKLRGSDSVISKRFIVGIGHKVDAIAVSFENDIVTDLMEALELRLSKIQMIDAAPMLLDVKDCPLFKQQERIHVCNMMIIIMPRLSYLRLLNSCIQIVTHVSRSLLTTAVDCH